MVMNAVQLALCCHTWAPSTFQCAHPGAVTCVRQGVENPRGLACLVTAPLRASRQQRHSNAGGAASSLVCAAARKFLQCPRLAAGRRLRAACARVDCWVLILSEILLTGVRARRGVRQSDALRMHAPLMNALPRGTRETSCAGSKGAVARMLLVFWIQCVCEAVCLGCVACGVWHAKRPSVHSLNGRARSVAGRSCLAVVMHTNCCLCKLSRVAAVGAHMSF